MIALPRHTDTSELIELFTATPEDARRAPPTLVLAAHPDDEVIGAGARLPRLRGAALFAHVTDGAPVDDKDARANGFASREEYARARRRELMAALSLAGLDESSTRELGLVDQEASLRLASLAGRVAHLLHELRPSLLLTHPYEGGHPDHDATAFAAHAACRLLERAGEPAPALVEMTSYHNGPGGIQPGVFLPAAGCEETSLVLSNAERAFKQRLLECFPTQRQTLQYFSTDVEKFRRAPRYDFTRPPHDGTLFYEQFSWGMTGHRFRALAGAAMHELGLSGGR
jgi:LmbE family N-acetylglucosaminyl deacetylase